MNWDLIISVIALVVLSRRFVIGCNRIIASDMPKDAQP